MAAGAVGVMALSGCVGPVQSEGNDGVAGSSGSFGSGDESVRTEQNTYQIDQQVARLVVDGRAGGITVIAAEGPISVTENLRYTACKPVTTHEVVGDVLRLSDQGCPDRPPDARCEVEYLIRAPAALAFDLTARAGGIEVTGLSGPITARSDAGGIEGRELASPTVTAEVDAGGVELSFTRPPDEVTAISGAGGVDIELPAGVAYAVQTEVGAGDAEVEVATDSGSPHTIRAESDAGGVEITTR